MTWTIAVAQNNPIQGDLKGNARQIIEAVRNAHAQGASLLLLPEGALTGLPLFDLAQRPAFVQACVQQVQAMAAALADLPGLAVVLPHLHGTEAVSPQQQQQDMHGCVHSHAGAQPALAILQAGQCRICAGAEDEAPCVVEVQGQRVALLWADACEEPVGGAANVQTDAAFKQRVRGIQQSGAHLLAVLGAAPYRMGGVQRREQWLQALARATGLPLISAHLVGGQGERVFDGASLAVQASGEVAGRAPQFAESVWPVEAAIEADGLKLHASTAAVAAPDGWVGHWPGQREQQGKQKQSEQQGQTAFAQPFNHAELWQALVLGLRDHVRKSGFREVLLGLSGGMDSALVLALAVDALGREQVRTLMMPTAYTADISLADAAEMAQRLGVRYDVLPIDPLCAAFDVALAPLFAGRGPDVTEENIQARVRGNLLMALSNKFGALLLATGNKSELSVGYCTLYGDMAGGLAPIKDLFKTQVYALARWRNAHDPFGTGAEPIPERIISRAPSAELRPDQTDQDSLPPYEVLDAILAGHVECNATAPQLLAAGLPREAVQQVLRLVRINEYKRQQAAPGLCISRRAYGCDGHMPLVNRFAEEV
ncbi:MAG: NAD+ synthase [Brachymonas sp.]|nr:NAD+ synthase [Brachymonas sp.]